MTEVLRPAEFFASQRQAIAEAAARGGGGAVIELIQGFGDPARRLTLYTMSRQVLIMGDPPERDLDVAMAVGDAGITEAALRFESAAAGPVRADFRRTLHIINFNLAADLADCWPDEEGKPALQPERRHFLRGLQAGRVLVSDLFAGTLEARVVANDYWVLGMHQLSLGDVEAAGVNWAIACAHAGAAATSQGKSTEVGTSATFQVNLVAGYRAIADWLAGEGAPAVTAYREAIHAFEEQAAFGDAADAHFGIAQLETVRLKYAARLS